jgi:hypothetical protein
MSRWISAMPSIALRECRSSRDTIKSRPRRPYLGLDQIVNASTVAAFSPLPLGIGIGIGIGPDTRSRTSNTSD